MKKTLKTKMHNLKCASLYPLVSSFFILTAPIALSSCWIVDIFKDEELEKAAINYNKRFDTKTKKENLTYKFGELSFVEYPYAKKNDGSYLYFFGPEGLKFLSKSFLERANYGPEITEIKEVTINKRYTNIETKDLNGFYRPKTNEIGLFTKSIVSNGKYVKDWTNVSIRKKVEMILPTLVHEYTHHIANTYNNSGKTNDPNYYSADDENSITYKLNKPIDKTKFLKQYTNNKKFLDEFREALNYKHQNAYSENLLANQNVFLDKKNLFRSFSSWELFEIANISESKINQKTFEKLLDFDLRNYTWNNKFLPIKFLNTISLQRIEYLYSFEELIPRELMKMSYTTLISPSKYLQNSLYFDDAWNNPYITAYGEDILRNIYNDIYEFNIVSPNWVFDRELKNFENRNKQYPFKNIVPMQNLKKLFKAYLDLMGYEQPISYSAFDKKLDNKNNIINDYQKIRFGGYLNKEKLDLNKKYFLNLGSHNYKLSIFNSNFIAKTNWDNKIDEKDKFLDFKKHFNYSKSMYSYITEPIVLKNNFQNYYGNKFDATLWTDKNNNGKYDLGEEIYKFNTLAAFNKQNIVKRSIINLRKIMENNDNASALNNSYKLELVKDNSEYKYSLVKY